MILGNTILHTAIKEQRRPFVIASLERDMSSTTIQNYLRQTPLDLACQYKDTHIIEDLLMGGADINGQVGHNMIIDISLSKCA